MIPPSTYLHILLPMLFSVLVGNRFLKFLRTFQSKGQPIRSFGPESHIVSKHGTPTMGGLMIIASFIGFSCILLDMSLISNQVVMFVFISHAILGAVDDGRKLAKKSSDGVRAKTKLLLQATISVVALYWLKESNNGIYSSNLYIPVFRYNFDLGILFIPFAALVIIASSNAVNLTDGLDGLVLVPVITVLVVLSILDPSISPVALIAIGSCIGFLWYNAFPAKVFMGDVGSLALGSLLGMLAIIVKQEIIFALASMLFIMESLSVIIQVLYFRFTGGDRIFPMTPVHHSFEKIGMHEVTVVVRLWIFSIFFGILALMVSAI